MARSPSPPEDLLRYYPFLRTLHDILDIALEEVERGPDLDCVITETTEKSRKVYLELLYQTHARHCKECGCPLQKGRFWSDKVGTVVLPRIIQGSGNPNSKVMFIGEGPGIGEWASYVPLVNAEEVLKTQCPECVHFATCYKTILHR